MEELLKNGWLLFITLIDWVWVASFIFTSYIVVRIFTKYKVINYTFKAWKWTFRVRKTTIILLWGVIWGLFFGFNTQLRLVYLTGDLAEINYITVLIFSYFGAIALHELLPISKYLNKWTKGDN